jgi:hypothetical protein
MRSFPLLLCEQGMVGVAKQKGEDEVYTRLPFHA